MAAKKLTRSPEVSEIHYHDGVAGSMLGATVADRVKKSAVFCENAANICFEKSEKQWLGTVNRCGRRSWRRDDLIAPGLAIILPGFAVTLAASCSSWMASLSYPSASSRQTPAPVAPRIAKRLSRPS